MADVDITITAIKSNTDAMQSAVTIISTNALPPDQTGAKIAIAEVPDGGSPVSLEIG